MNEDSPCTWNTTCTVGSFARGKNFVDEGMTLKIFLTSIHALPIIQTCEDDGEHDTEWDCDGLMGCCKQTQNGER